MKKPNTSITVIVCLIALSACGEKHVDRQPSVVACVNQPLSHNADKEYELACMLGNRALEDGDNARYEECARKKVEESKDFGVLDYRRIAALKSLTLAYSFQEKRIEEYELIQKLLLAMMQFNGDLKEEDVAWVVSEYRISRQAYFKRIAAELSKRIAASPFDASLYRQRSLAYCSVSEFKKAIADARNSVSCEPRNPKSFAYLAFACKSGGNTVEAIKAISDYISIVPNDPLGYAERARLYGLSKDARATNDLDEILQLEQNAERAHRQRAVVFLLLERSKQALDETNAAVSADHQSPESYYLRALAQSDLGNYTAALQDIDRALSLNNTVRRYFELRVALRKRVGTDEEAAKADRFAALARTTADDADAIMNGRSYDSPIAEIIRAPDAVAPAVATNLELSDDSSLLAKAKSAFQKSENVQAEQYLLNALEASDKTKGGALAKFEILASLGSVERSLGNTTQAKLFFQRALDLQLSGKLPLTSSSKEMGRQYAALLRSVGSNGQAQIVESQLGIASENKSGWEQHYLTAIAALKEDSNYVNAMKLAKLAERDALQGGEKDPRLIQALSLQIEICYSQENWNGAAAVFRREISILEKDHPEEKRARSEAYSSYASLLRRMGKENEAAIFDARAADTLNGI